MNAASNSISTPDFITGSDDSDSDASSDEIPDYYLPISSSDPDFDANDTDLTSTAYHLALDQLSNASLSNGHHFPAVNVVPQPHVEVEVEEEEPSMLEEEEDDEEEMRRQAESESAIRIAFLEDESRRRAPLPSHNAARVMEAMRGVSFSASPPQWAHHLDDHIQRLRPPPSSTA